MYVGAVGAESKKISTKLADDQYGAYRITEIKYCVGSFEECTLSTPARYKTCNLRDNTTEPVNAIDAQVVVRLNKEIGCTAEVN